jgi:hypothetical protein
MYRKKIVKIKKVNLYISQVFREINNRYTHWKFCIYINNLTKKKTEVKETLHQFALLGTEVNS